MSEINVAADSRHDDAVKCTKAVLSPALDTLKSNIANTLVEVSTEYDVDINDLALIFFANLLEHEIVVAYQMGVTVNIDGFFDAMKKKIEREIEAHPFSMSELLTRLLNMPVEGDCLL